MGFKVSLNEKKDVMDFVSNISDDIMINGLISDLINRDGVANFFCNDDGSYSFSLINNAGEKFYLLLSGDVIYISNNFDGIRQHILYKNEDGEKYINISNVSIIEVPGNCINRNVSIEKKYDNFGNVFERKIIKTCDSNCDEFENSYFVSSNYTIDGKCILIKSICYDYRPELNSSKYFIADGDKYVSISEDEYMNMYAQKIEKKGLQKVKSVV